ncbi:hypothetical protein Q7C36_018877 [Tachysurus vachellii]|uniref:Uncharacterized protein n=1 Tax=Tachysurus vachellii TaxID=175792 RepID=A0AA88LVJ3_TACVA|nr:hypothetical protein Q7C36_018877 [Tachysurus vachellii]
MCVLRLNMTGLTQHICYDMCTAALTCVSDICVMLVNVFTCGGESCDLPAVAEVSEGSVEGLSVEETESAGSRSSVHPFFLT